MCLDGLIVDEPEGLVLHGQRAQVVDPLLIPMGIDGESAGSRGAHWIWGTGGGNARTKGGTGSGKGGTRCRNR